ncbi:hypothetical protein HOLleu_10240 [Holothuria leucospilota]|uniref:Uncharacterized protein n=1 Tax=Holothuria leucospilota TaxID=206669 RepID=A0A9Q1HBK3_HOLLE|nr:hypothetical protein HOLleu_10240 [Holothuria leucospilota]
MGKLVVDQLIFSLNDESLRLKLLEHRWSTLEDFVSFADNLMIARLSHRGRASQRNNPTSPKRGNNAFSSSRAVQNSQQVAHSKPNSQSQSQANISTQRQSPQSQTQLNQGSNSNAFRCFTCNEIGHLSYNCPNSPNETLNFIRFSTEDCCEELVRFPNINTSTIPKLDGAYFEATVNGKVTLAYADSGSAKTLINASEVELTDIIPLDSPMNLTFLDGTPLVVLGKVVFNLSIAGVKDEAEAFVSDIPCPILLGRDLLAKLGLVFDISDNSYWAEKVRPRVKYPLLWIDRWGGPIQKGSSDTGLGLCLQKSLQSVSEVTDETGDDNETKNNIVSGKIQGYDECIDSIIEQYSVVFVDRPGYCNLIKHSIDTGDAKPVRQRPYRQSPSKRENLKLQIEQMLDLDIITPSDSEWCSPVVMVMKPDASFRLAIDYRKLNAVTKPSNYPIPTIESVLNSMHDAQVFSTLDLKAGFWQSAIHESDQVKTAFVCEEGVYQFKRLPFGLKNASQHFQQLIDTVFKPLNNSTVGKCYYPYIDDILIHSPSIEVHFQDLQDVLDCLRKAGLTVNPAKCQLLYERIKFLGYIVDGQGLRLNPAKCEAVQNYPPPTDKKSLERFLGLSGWCAKFVPNYAKIVEPLNTLRRKDVPWHWDASCENAFLTLKDEIVKSVILTIPDFRKSFEVHTDASANGLGAVLIQRDMNGNQE